MNLREDVVYLYDGTLDGMLSCIFESFAQHELPTAIFSPRQTQNTLFETRVVPSNQEKANRVVQGLIRVAGEEAAELAQLAYLTAIPDKELTVLRFVRLAMKSGPATCSMLTDYRVNIIHRAVRHLQIEVHHLCGFIRFIEQDGTLVSVVTPKNDVLPLLDDYFSNRLPEERFVIYDRGRQVALMHLPETSRIVPLKELCFPHISEQEMNVQQLWLRFFQTVSVSGRTNPLLQRNMLPMRFRENMTEFQTSSSSKGALIHEKSLCRRSNSV